MYMEQFKNKILFFADLDDSIFQTKRKDANGKYWYFPYMQLSASGEGSGTARADGSKYSVTLVAENEFLAYEVTMTPAALQAIGVNF